MTQVGGAGPDQVDDLKRRYRGALLGVVVGDALGAPFEGHAGPVPPAFLGRIEAGEAPLRYTDDTTMTFALAESLLFCGRLDLDHLAATFASTYQREPYRGYGAAVAQLLSRVAAGAGWAQAAASLAGMPPGSPPSDVAAATGTGITGIEAVPAAIAAAALNLDSFADTVRFAISLGGDTDTIAAMAGAISGARLGEDAVPAAWLRRVEGVEKARDLADRLAAAHTRKVSWTAGDHSLSDQ